MQTLAPHLGLIPGSDFLLFSSYQSRGGNGVGTGAVNRDLACLLVRMLRDGFTELE